MAQNNNEQQPQAAKLEKFNSGEIAKTRAENAPAITETPQPNAPEVETPQARPSSAKEAPTNAAFVEPSNRDVREGKAIVDGVNEATKTLLGKDLGLTSAQQTAMTDSLADVLANIKARLPWGVSVLITMALMALPIALPGILKMLADKRKPKAEQEPGEGAVNE